MQHIILFIIILTITSNEAKTVGNCLADLIGNALCTANDVVISNVDVISGPSICVNGTTIYVQLQAQTVATSNLRYDIGYFVALDGGNAKTGSCFRDYLPSPLNTLATVGSVRTSPFFNAEFAQDPNDICGDIEQGKTNNRNLGGTTVSSGTQGPPTIIAIPCKDNNNDGFADVSTCTSWDILASNGTLRPSCTTVNGTLPGTASKCNCTSTQLGRIIYKSECSSDSDCNDNNACTNDRCFLVSGLGVCENLPIGSGTPCNDGNSCTENDKCGGTNNLICSGTPVICAALDQCHFAGTCDFATGICSNPDKPNLTPCDDNQSCTVSDSCTDGSCIGTDTCKSGFMCQSGSCVPEPNCQVNLNCDDNNLCTNDFCDNGFCSFIFNDLPCTDGDACTLGDTCVQGECISGDPVICTPLDQCHQAGVCNIGNGLCSNPPKINGESCNDGINCTSPDTCIDGSCIGTLNCAVGEICQNDQCVDPPECVFDFDCDDLNICTDDACVNGQCAYTNNGLACNDGNPCTIDDICLGGICQSGLPKVCIPLDQCHLAGTCDSITGICDNLHAIEGTPCDDGISCTAEDKCTEGICSGTNSCPLGQTCENNQCTGIAICTSDAECLNHNICTDDFCINGNCVHINNVLPCDDGNACTSNDTCLDGSCMPGIKTICVALDQCHTVGTCNTITGICSDPAKPNSTICDDADPCTLNDTCIDGVCQQGMPVICDNPGICQTGGTCTNADCIYETAPNGTSCSTNAQCIDGICVTQIQCLQDSDCIALECLTATCENNECAYSFSENNEGNPCGANNVCHGGACVECIEASDCAGTNECNLATCSPNNQCIYSSRVCDQGSDCTINSCNPNEGCIYTPVFRLCGSVDQCNSPICDATNGCTIIPLSGNKCDDGIPCTFDDSCNNGLCVGTTKTCVVPDTCSTATCNQEDGQCEFIGCPAPTFCNNQEPVGACVQCDELIPCQNNLACENGICVGCISDSDCISGDKCVIGSCTNNECHYEPNRIKECLPKKGHCGNFGRCPNSALAPLGPELLPPSPMPIVEEPTCGPGENLNEAINTGAKATQPVTSTLTNPVWSCTSIGNNINDLWGLLMFIAFILKKKIKRL